MSSVQRLPKQIGDKRDYGRKLKTEISIKESPMSLSEGFLIIEKPEVAHTRYLNSRITKIEGWQDNLKRLREHLSFINPAAYRGISRNPLYAFPFDNLEALRNHDYYHADVNTAARIRMFELQNHSPKEEDDIDSAMLSSLEQARDVYKLLDSDKRDDYEIIKIVNNPYIEKSNTLEVQALGYDIGYWRGDQFSIICDSAIRPMWHPPAWDD